MKSDSKSINPDDSPTSSLSSTTSDSESKQHIFKQKLTLVEYIELAKEASEEARFKFEYELMAHLLENNFVTLDIRKFYSGRIEQNFFRLNFREPDELRELKGLADETVEYSPVGWKVHIAIDDSNRINLAKAWNIIKNILIEEQFEAKVVKPDSEFFKDNIQYGKQITIYCCYEPLKNWEDILKRIEYELSNANVIPDKFPMGDKQIPGSNYIAYRNDDRGNGTYISSMDAKFKYNYCEAEDPFIGLDMTPPRFHRQRF